MASGTLIAQHFPWVTTVGGRQIAFRLMREEDREEALQFVRGLPEQDLFYLMNDIRNSSGMNRWIEGIRDGSVITVLAGADKQDCSRVRQPAMRPAAVDPPFWARSGS